MICGFFFDLSHVTSCVISFLCLVVLSLLCDIEFDRASDVVEDSFQKRVVISFLIFRM